MGVVGGVGCVGGVEGVGDGYWGVLGVEEGFGVLGGLVYMGGEEGWRWKVYIEEYGEGVVFFEFGGVEELVDEFGVCVGIIVGFFFEFRG